MAPIDLPTPHGLARVHLSAEPGAELALVLGHGAGGGVGARDLQMAASAAAEAGVAVALVEQPYRVAGRRSPAPATQLDASWLAVIAHLRSGPFDGARLIFGGRSMGARVACRTAPAGGAIAVLCLAFPLLPPARATARKPPHSRLDELDGVGLPTLVIQGERDQFGMPPDGPQRRVVRIAGDHSLRGDLSAARAAIGQWLSELRAADH